MSTLPAKIVETFVNEAQDTEFKFKYGASLVGSAISFIAYDTVDLTDDTVLATANGSGEGTVYTLNLQTSALEVGVYEVEVWKDKGETFETLIYPPTNVRFRMVVQTRNGRSVGDDIFSETFDLTFD